jgi:carbamoyl-phosphate synthase small subunit
MEKKLKASLILEDGTVFEGYSFGAIAPAAGEVVFNTAMTGYPESLTDPSYCGQILVLTSPMIGNYGVPPWDMEGGLPRFFESDRIYARALVVADYTPGYSHWNAVESLGAWLERSGVPAICGIDTRQLTRHIRDHGVMPGRVVVEGCDEAPLPAPAHPVAEVSCRQPITYGDGPLKVVLVDCGCKYNIIRCLTSRGATVVRVPWDYDFTAMDYDGVMLGNGPGDPTMCAATVEHIKKAMESGKPIFGICLGHQLLSMAAGAKTYKLKYGHRSHNQPVLIAGTNSAFITSQNHGYAVDAATLPDGWEPWFTNINDGTNEGIRHRSKPFRSVQFHPEASSGPVDTEFLFDEFVALMRKG